MKLTDFQRKELIKENKKINKRLNQRISNLKKYSAGVNSPALTKYKELKKKYNLKNISRMRDKTLINLNRDIRYINALKSSRVSGLKKFNRYFEPMVNELKKLSKEEQELFWENYQNLVEEYRMLEKFKYDIFDNIKDKLEQGVSVDRIFEDYRERMRYAIEKNIEFDKKILFSSKKVSK